MLQKQSCRKSLQRPRVCVARAICGEEADQGGAGELMCRSGSGPVTMTSVRGSPGMAREVQATAVEAALVAGLEVGDMQHRPGRDRVPRA